MVKEKSKIAIIHIGLNAALKIQIHLQLALAHSGSAQDDLRVVSVVWDHIFYQTWHGWRWRRGERCHSSFFGLGKESEIQRKSI